MASPSAYVPPTLLKEVDLALVHALQVDARAPWARIADVVGVDAATVARRWAAISGEGLAWFTVWPTPERHAPRTDAALVLVRGPVADDDLATWCATPWVHSVERTSAGVVAIALGHGGLADFDERIRQLFQGPGLDLDVEYAAAVPREDSAWWLGVLSARQVRDLTVRPQAAGRPPQEDVVAEVVALLTQDPRMSWGHVATGLGVSEATARRTVERVLAHGLVRVGCDVAMPSVGLGRGVVVRARAADPTEATAVVLSSPQVHRALHLLGPAPVTVSCRLSWLADLPALERSWGGAVEVLDRWTVTRVLKRNGHLLAVDGRSTGRVDVEW
ncbi:MAG: AsnC family transcriptional regulator [Nocardioides sp.]|uniref:AsnC family transcriptional regulator n=1 Tax=Nocardioides sp. TaxID=35761 RepID=UPI003F049493